MQHVAPTVVPLPSIHPVVSPPTPRLQEQFKYDVPLSLKHLISMDYSHNWARKAGGRDDSGEMQDRWFEPGFVLIGKVPGVGNIALP